MELSLLQWNVWCKEEADKIVDLIKDNQADILCLQEVVNTSKTSTGVNLAEAISEFGYEYCFSVNSSKRGDQWCAIFSKFPIKNHEQFYVQDAEPDKSPPKYDRTYLEAEIETPKGLLRVGTTHLGYSHYFKRTEDREKEANKLLEALGNKDSRYILAGDFNSMPDSFLVKDLLDKFHNVGPDFSEKTWTTKPFSYHGFETNELGWRLDYIFATDDIEEIDSYIVKTEASDHLPIFSKIML